MSLIGSIGRTITPAYLPDRIASPAPNRAANPTASAASGPVDRVDKLTRQLDASLTLRLAGIRSRISTSESAPTESAGGGRRLDIGA